MVAYADHVYVAGDDDQAIYVWSGADIEEFLNLRVKNTEVLQTSYRLPKKIFDLANTISKKITHRYEKVWQPREEDGNAETGAAEPAQPKPSKSAPDPKGTPPASKSQPPVKAPLPWMSKKMGADAGHHSGKKKRKKRK